MSVIALLVRKSAALSGLGALALVVSLGPFAVPGARAQAFPGAPAAAARNHQLVITRTVQPRIAYRGIPLADHPVQAQATVFPGEVFHDTLGQTLDLVLGTDLDQRGSVGVDAGGAARSLLAQSLPAFGGASRFGGHAAASAPLGSGASVGTAASGATRGLGGLVTGSLLPALGAGNASQQGGGP
ncbi:hypothetical protein ACFQZQ_10470 [Lysobacter koreensis]|uniref:Uncharacterized protein n=1 Tax=Lysobacter koreensis TaxID=266122 RepID=A0ABW2YMV5_9GAMM